MGNPVIINANKELTGLIELVEELFRLEDKLEKASGTSGLRHNIQMQKRIIKTAMAQYKMIEKQQQLKQFKKPATTQNYLYK